MIIKIAKTEVEAMKLVAALCSIKATFYTIETNDGMVKVELTETDGNELTAKDTWHICRSFCFEIEVQNMRTKINETKIL